MPELIEAYNREFAITPADSKDSHIRLNEDDIASLDVVLANWQTRVVSTNLTVSCGKEILQIIGLDSTMRYAMKRERQKFCVHGIIGARQTGASNEHEHQTQFS